MTPILRRSRTVALDRQSGVAGLRPLPAGRRRRERELRRQRPLHAHVIGAGPNSLSLGQSPRRSATTGVSSCRAAARRREPALGRDADALGLPSRRAVHEPAGPEPRRDPGGVATRRTGAPATPATTRSRRSTTCLRSCNARARRGRRERPGQASDQPLRAVLPDPVGLIVVGTVAGFYILLQQRLPNPFQSFYTVNAAFPSGGGRRARVSASRSTSPGVRVGEITGTDRCVNGHGDDPHGHRPVRRSRTCTTTRSAEPRPEHAAEGHGGRHHARQPVGRRTADGRTIPVSQTTSPTDSDELLDALDTDTRTWFTSLITDLNKGTQGRGSDIRKLLTNLGPTSQQLRQIGDLLAARRTELSDDRPQPRRADPGGSGQGLAAASKSCRRATRPCRRSRRQDVALRSAITKLPGTLATTRQDADRPDPVRGRARPDRHRAAPDGAEAADDAARRAGRCSRAPRCCR